VTRGAETYQVSAPFFILPPPVTSSLSDLGKSSKDRMCREGGTVDQCRFPSDTGAYVVGPRTVTNRDVTGTPLVPPYLTRPRLRLRWEYTSVQT
jgi:hypothetical protein